MGKLQQEPEQYSSKFVRKNVWDTGAAESESPQYICGGNKELLLRISKEDELGQLKKKVDTCVLAIAIRQSTSSRKR